MIYEFRDQQGNPVELDFDMGKCPVKIGEVLVLDDGRQVTRLFPSIGEVRVPDVMHEAFNMPSSRHGIDPDVPRYSKPGNGFLGDFPLFANKREIAEYEAKKAAKGSKVKYDP